jgi:hypothetical protein
MIDTGRGKRTERSDGTRSGRAASAACGRGGQRRWAVSERAASGVRAQPWLGGGHDRRPNWSADSSDVRRGARAVAGSCGPACGCAVTWRWRTGEGGPAVFSTAYTSAAAGIAGVERGCAAVAACRGITDRGCCGPSRSNATSRASASAGRPNYRLHRTPRSGALPVDLTLIARRR